MREEILFQRREMRLRHRHIGLAPPDGVRGLGILDDELVPGAAPGVLAGGDDERAVLGEQALAMADRILHQPRRAPVFGHVRLRFNGPTTDHHLGHCPGLSFLRRAAAYLCNARRAKGQARICNGCRRSEEHTSELQSLMRNSYAVFCLKKKNKTYTNT